MNRKHNESVEKLASLRFELFGKAHKHHKIQYCIFVDHSRAHTPHADLHSAVLPALGIATAPCAG
jgi:hypothetical protein